ncbi:putative nuclease HARBI1 [Nasonia vitripennis]|uniref:DDE Tnp4 domain-containing protein n=1 Tax=Nasonia vitripennis TaxID=7425 RepID=A0A7M7QJV0_NASVI|nr:putative nuclease HARBI1 [Nasonia vitripennis]
MNLEEAVGIQAIMFDSSSSSSDDDVVDEFDLVLNDHERGNQNENRRPRVHLFIESVIYRYNEAEFQENYRQRRTTFYYLLHLIRPHIQGEAIGFGKLPIPPEKQLFIALYVLGTPDSYRSVTAKFDVGKATAWRAVHRIVTAICEYRNYFIQWPSQNEAIATFNRIEARYGFPKVIGAVDGTHIQIPAPRRDAQSYINRKSVHSIQLQVICNDRLEFIHMRVFRYSGVQQKCNAEFFPENSHLLGDSAYSLQNHAIVPYHDDGHLTLEQIYFNRLLSGTRMMVERLVEKLPMRRTDLIPYYVLCCCILHNICLKREDTFEYPVVIPDTIDMNPAPLLVDAVLQQEGAIKRNAICHYVNIYFKVKINI